MINKNLYFQINLQLFADSSEKTEAPTPKRREEARKKGQAPKSQDLAQVATLFVGVILINITFKQSFSRIYNVLSEHFQEINVDVLSMEKFGETMVKFSELFFVVTSPILLSVLIIGILVNYLQVGFMFTLETVKPSLEKINPLKGLKNLLSMKKVVDLLKTLIKMGIIGGYAYLVIRGNVEEYLKIPFINMNESFKIVGKLCFDVVIKIATGLLVVAFADYIYQRWEFERSLKMSKQEIKEEFKQTEGDPLIKSKLRQMQRDLLNRKMIEEVPKATVVITNPTHLSIALKYEKGMGAPEVVAKGADFMALRIREVAKESKIPIMENKPLARAMYPVVEPGSEIPEEYYQAVAEILAVILNK